MRFYIMTFGAGAVFGYLHHNQPLEVWVGSTILVGAVGVFTWIVWQAVKAARS